MKFIDTATLKVKGGRGGDGCISFRKEKYVPRGGPNGGNGGHGGNVVLMGDHNRQTLLDLRYQHKYFAQDGEKGRGKDQHGKCGQDLIIPVPLGTLVRDAETGALLCDITTDGQTFTVATGGRGGRGNMCFVNPTRRAPRYAEEGRNGEEKSITLELKLIADVGIIGFPNAGKSTFISVVSAARPKIADYPFTTLTPNLGVVKGQYAKPYVIADMPGLIEGAHDGAGLGHRFLRHIERTRLLVHFVDSSEESSMVTRYETIRKELSMYSKRIAVKQELVVATKMDSAIEENVEEFRNYLQEKEIPLYAVSSLSKEGLQELLEGLETRLDSIERDPEIEMEFEKEEKKPAGCGCGSNEEECGDECGCEGDECGCGCDGYEYEYYECSCEEECPENCECPCHLDCVCDENCEDDCPCACHLECECDENCTDECECECHDEECDDCDDCDDDDCEGSCGCEGKQD